MLRLFLFTITLLLSSTLFADGGKPATGYTETKHPIVLVHGLWGFDDIFGIDYWYDIEQSLEEDGATVYTVNLPSGNSDTVRGEALITELDKLRYLHKHTRFHLLGHSQGGLTSRYVAGTRPELIASVTTMATPHFGGGADNAPDTEPTPEFLAGLANLFPNFIDILSGIAPQGDINAAFASLSKSGTAELNALFDGGKPATFCGEGAVFDNGIYYYSMSGVAQITNVFDPADIILAFASLGFDDKEHDGQVSRCSSHWGKVIRDDYYLNHVDQVNHLFGLRGLNAPDPRVIYRAQANRLKKLGL